MKFTILVDLFLVINNIHLICLFYAAKKRTRGGEILHFQYMTFMARPQGGFSFVDFSLVMTLTIYVDPSLVIVTIYLVCLIYA